MTYLSNLTPSCWTKVNFLLSRFIIFHSTPPSHPQAYHSTRPTHPTSLPPQHTFLFISLTRSWWWVFWLGMCSCLRDYFGHLCPLAQINERACFNCSPRSFWEAALAMVFVMRCAGALASFPRAGVIVLIFLLKEDAFSSLDLRASCVMGGGWGVSRSHNN
jgi:hypothetical protein